MKPRILSLLRWAVCLGLLLIQCWPALAQRRYWHRWQYQTAGLEFTTGQQPGSYRVNNGADGAVQIADSTGSTTEFFFNTASNVAFAPCDRNGTTLPNAFFLASGIVQDALLVPWPHHSNAYLGFYVRNSVGQADLRYAVIDRTARGGLGDISLRGFLSWQTDSISPRLQQAAWPGLGVVPHANGRDYWIITTTTTEVAVYLVSPLGVSRTAVRSPLLSQQQSVLSGTGYPTVLRPTSRGNGFIMERDAPAPVAGAVYRVEYYPFDNRTGRVATGRLLLADRITSSGATRGFTPSPNGQRVYAVGGNNSELELAQFDLTAPDSAAFRASRQRVYAGAIVGGSLATWNIDTPLRTGPNGKIYGLFNTDSLSIINCPDAPAAQCGFVRNGLGLPGGGNIMLPNDHIPAAFYALPGFSLANAPLNSMCFGQALRLSLDNGQYLDSARWQFGDGGRTTSLLPVQHAYAQPGTYRVLVRVWYNGCATDTLSRVVTVLPAPTLHLPADTLACAGTALELRPSQLGPGPLRYAWSTGATTPTLVVTQPGQYTLTVTTAAGCQASATATVRPAAVPTVALPADSVLCATGGARLLRPLASPDVVSYRWQDGSTAPTYQATQPGTYTLTVGTAAGCTATARTVLRPAAVPTQLLGPDTTACLGAPALLRLRLPQGQTAAVRWPDGSTGPTYSVRETGTYRATVTLAGGCQYEAQVQVSFGECPDQLTIPNIITPNNDHLNDAFVIEGLAPGQWRLEIYSRWGQPVYDHPGYVSGTWTAEGLAAGSYLYRLSRPGYQLRGWVEVVR
jgi:PKD repeat protein